MGVQALRSRLSSDSLIMVEEAYKLVESGPIVLLSLPFLLSAGTITHIGVLVFGYVWPMYCTLELTSHSHSSALSSAPSRRESRSDHEQQKVQQWLEYWTAFCVVDQLCEVVFATVGVWPLFNHSRLLLALWLQNPYFSGASVVVQSLEELLLASGWTVSPGSMGSEKGDDDGAGEKEDAGSVGRLLTDGTSNDATSADEQAAALSGDDEPEGEATAHGPRTGEEERPAKEPERSETIASRDDVDDRGGAGVLRRRRKANSPSK